jgi:hypothetical protein
MRSSRLLPWVLAGWTIPALPAAVFNATGVEQGLFSGLERYLSQSRFPLRALHPQIEVAYGQVTDVRGPSYADTKNFNGRLCDTSENGRLGFFLDASYAGSRQDARTSSAPLETSPLDITGIGAGAFLELPVLAQIGVYGEYAYYSHRLSFRRPVGVPLIPEKDALSQGRYGIRLFATDSDTLSLGRISGQADYLPPLQTEYSWRHLLGGRSSFVLRYLTGTGVKSWEAAFGLGF